jgi:UDP-glucose 4-epimerase
LIPRVLGGALGKFEQIEVFGADYPTADGTCVRDYVHVSDLADAHLLALEALERSGRLIYNLGNGNGFSVREVIEIARKVTGRTIRSVDSPRRPGDPAVLIASSEKIRRELKWKPKFSDLETIIASAWEWHRRHPEGYAQAHPKGSRAESGFCDEND